MANNYEIIISIKAYKFIKKLKDNKLKGKFESAFLEISVDPYIGDAKLGDLAGFYCYDVFYNKTNYEIAYTIHEGLNKIVVVVLVGTRENFYEELKRNM